MGAHFHHTAVHATWDELSAFRSRRGLALWGADAAGTPIGGEQPPKRLGLVVGNEGAGLTDSVRSSLDRLVSIPMSPRAESLNVAVAAGILLHEVRA
jgi:tRNA G18 (ribose-2'-O)-methylase SpoU